MAMGDLARQDEYGDDLVMPPQTSPFPAWDRKVGAATAGSLDALKFARRYMDNPAGAYPPGSEEAQFLADNRERAGRTWGAKTGISYVLDPLPGLANLARGARVGSTTAFGSGAGGAAAGAGEGRMGALAKPPPIRAYHSSPHDFERFDASKIGTGEGAQVYGHGIYFAQNPAVSGQGGEYWKQFQRRFQGPEYEAAEFLKSNKFNRKEAIAAIEDVLPWHEFNAKNSRTAQAAEGNAKLVKDLAEARSLLESGKPVGPRTYEVNINTQPEQLLNWDMPVTQQGALNLARVESGAGFTGENIYKRLRAAAPNRNPAAYVSDQLRDVGIPGIRYLDQHSRVSADHLKDLLRVHGARGKARQAVAEWANNAGPDAEYWAGILRQMDNQTHNYVMFPGTEGLIDITKKYVLPAATAGGMGSLAAQDQYQ
jgi:hypothetical protein